MNIFEMIKNKSVIASITAGNAPQGVTVENVTVSDSVPSLGHVSCALAVDCMSELEVHELFIDNCDNQLSID